MNQIFQLKRMIPELEDTLAQKRKEMAHINQESRMYDNADNLHPIATSESDTNSPYDFYNPLDYQVYSGNISIVATNVDAEFLLAGSYHGFPFQLWPWYGSQIQISNMPS